MCCAPSRSRRASTASGWNTPRAATGSAGGYRPLPGSRGSARGWRYGALALEALPQRCHPFGQVAAEALAAEARGVVAARTRLESSGIALEAPHGVDHRGRALLGEQQAGIFPHDFGGAAAGKGDDRGAARLRFSHHDAEILDAGEQERARLL